MGASFFALSLGRSRYKNKFQYEETHLPESHRLAIQKKIT